MVNDRTSNKMKYASNYIDIYHAKMHYLEVGQGDPILFLHGIPTSSYIWRNIMPHLASLGRCIAPDLIGFGHSDKPDIEYSVFDHIKYLEKFIEVLNLKQITLIMHGWGSVIGFDYAMRHEKNCKGLVFYEAFLRSLNGNDVSLPYQAQVSALQDQDHLSAFDANGISYVDKIISQHAMQQLTQEVMSTYREPFAQPGSSCKPILQYIKELPMNGQGKVEELIVNYSKKLTKSKLPKLMLYSVPGFITTIATVMWAKEHLPNLEIIEVGEELHLALESYPALIGETISAWLQGIEQVRT